MTMFNSLQDIAETPNMEIQFVVIDLFCGFGGVTEGFEKARAETILASLSKSLGPNLPKISKVVGCVNHDKNAIKSHWSNYPEVEHFEEDIKKLYGKVINGILFKSPQLIRLQRLVNIYRAMYPKAKVILWASLECVNFSKAKGGMSRDQDSRTLAEHLFPYIFAIDPDLIMIENVVEFMSWGPMKPKTGKTKEGYPYSQIVIVKPEKNKRRKPSLRKPGKNSSPADILDWEIKNWDLTEKWKSDNQIFVTPHWVPEKVKNGIDWLRWRNNVNALGYRDSWKQLNSADFGARTSRNRLFGVFAKPDMPIIWPQATHSKKPKDNPIDGRPLKKWNAVKEVLDFSREGKSVFNRPTPLKPTTMERLFKGSIKHIAGGKDVYLSRYYGGNAEYRNHSVEEPAGTLTTNNRLAIVNHTFISKYFSGHPESKSSSINNPASTIKPKDNQYLVRAINFIDQRNGGKADHKSRSVDEPAKTLTATGGNQQLVHANFIINYNHSSDSSGIQKPAPTITTHDKLGKVQANFIDRQFSQGKQNQSIDEPMGSLTTVPKANYIQADFFIDKQYSGIENNQSIDKPAGTITTNDKHCLIKTDKWLMNTNFNNIGHSLDNPSPVLMAGRHHHYLVGNDAAPAIDEDGNTHLIVQLRKNEEPIYYIASPDSPVIVPVYSNECEYTIKLKEFMVLFHIVDIKMRMLMVRELLQIQGFPADYKMEGFSETVQKKFIGNSVVPAVVENWILAYSRSVFEDDYERYRMAA